MTYETPDCFAPGGLPASPATNTKRCQPVRWSPDPSLSERLDWFHKYVVKSITQSDDLAGTTPIETHYEYLGGGAWRYDEVDGMTPEDQKTWSQWRGYGRVKTRTGNQIEGQMVNEVRYFRGMDGDRTASGGQKDVWVTDSRGVGFEAEDHDRLAGTVRETIAWLADETSMLSRSIDDPWISEPTATSVKPWGTTRATLVDTLRSHKRAAVEGGWRDSLTEKTIEADGTVTAVSSKPDVDKPEFDTCTRYEFVSNTTKHLIDLPKRVETVAKACDATPARPADVISDALSFYDGNATHGAEPTKGLVTRVDEFSGWDTAQNRATYQTMSLAKYDDPHGRLTESVDVKGGVSRTVYTPATGGPVTSVKTINPLLHESVSYVEPAFGAQTATVDANGLRTDIQLDALGRLSKVWGPGRTKGTDTPDAEFAYLIANNGADVITTKRLQPTGGYQTKYELYDGFGRLRQSQIPAVGGGRAVSDMIYDSRGLLVKKNGPYFNASPPGFEVLVVADNAIASQARTIYDLAGRPTNEIAFANGAEKWRTIIHHTGIDRVDVDPPTGGTATTTITDARGNKIKLRQYKGSSPTSSYDETTYSYNNKGQLTTVTDAAPNGGNKWQYFYDVRGRVERTVDPDRGTTLFTYNLAGEQETVTAQDGKKLAYAYDALGRSIALHDDSLSGTKRAEWVYDTLHKGMPTSSTRYVDGNAWTTRVVGYDNVTGQPTGSEISVPASEGVLAGTYRFDVTYMPDGSPATTKMPAAGGLAEETLTYGYNTYGLPTTLAGSTTSGTTSYVDLTEYTSYAEPSLIGLGSGAKWVDQEFFYEVGTRRLQGSRVATGASGSGYITNSSYTYDAVGNVTAISEVPTGVTADKQCFRYDYLTRLSQAWTPGDGNCGPDPTVNGLGGPAKYWHSWTYDETGNRTSQTVHAAGGDTTSTYSYPAPGQPQPHTMTQVQITDPAGTKTVTYGYDAVGNTTSRPGTGAERQTLTWDAEGRLAQVVEGGQVSTFVYDADGNRIAKRDASGTTVYLPGMELNSVGGATKTAIRYYSHGGQTVAVRTDDNKLTWLFADHHGTNSVAVDAVSQAVQRRYSTPFGGDRGDVPPPAWPDDKGFVGGVKDDTGLTHLGAREYDPQTGRFISVDPIIDPSDPQQMHGYAYAGNAPTSYVDASGLRDVCGTGSNDFTCGDTSTDETMGSRPDTPAKTPQEIIDDAKAEKERAEAVKKKSLLDVIIEQGLAFLLDFFGITDIINCFTKGDLGACVSTLVNMIPWGKIFKAAKSIIKGVKQAFTAYKSWQKAIRLADEAIARADEAIAMAKQKADEIAAALASKQADAAADAADSCLNNSFVPGTLVLMADGSTKPIEDVRVGDEVIATDPETGESGPRVVTREITGSGDKTLVEINIDVDGDEGDATNTITATDGHPFWVTDPGRWTNAAALRPGDTLLTPGGSRVRVIDIVAYNAVATVHNLTVDDIHTFYVIAGDTPVLAHNISGACVVHGPTALPGRDPADCNCASGGAGSQGNGLDEGAPEAADRRISHADEVSHQRTRSESVVRGAKQQVDAVKAGGDPIIGGVIAVVGAWAQWKAKRSRRS
ncbi:polymorphic toxin-type HINT domain-containing protein [Micromonospora sonneratiae]|uniref:Polymorphic toxin-type HINT domain-containing protein n=1 Tax=Micromonospora sonneratiae TaxID=1184706 RepID=A0ABW3YCQ5_9ACTN